MTLIEEAVILLEKLPEENQHLIVDLLRVMNFNEMPSIENSNETIPFKRTGKSNFNLPEDFDEHFNDINDEIEALFYEN